LLHLHVLVAFVLVAIPIVGRCQQITEAVRESVAGPVEELIGCLVEVNGGSRRVSWTSSGVFAEVI
jgi:hypothetical protein